jgi:glycosyltransferase involved in cell wall biosynthesis
MARVLFVEPFYGGSHKAFLDGLVRHSTHDIDLLTLPEGEWRRRMRRGAEELAHPAKQLKGQFDCLIASDMLDLPALLAFTRPRFDGVPVAVYFHENQMTYPRLKGTKFNSWFGQINYHSALAADAVAFNSEFHRGDFLDALEVLVEQPNNWLLPTGIETIRARSEVLPIGVELDWVQGAAATRTDMTPRTILWNHRWEFDKAPELFARNLRSLKERGVPFRLIIAGEPGLNPSDAITGLEGEFFAELTHFGYAPSREQYAALLAQSDILVSTTRHEFFGIGAVEAMAAGCIPLAPRRYNYPALIPKQFHQQLLWDDEPDLLDKLGRLLTGPALDSRLLEQAALAWSWNQVAPKWDGFICRLARGSGKNE